MRRGIDDEPGGLDDRRGISRSDIVDAIDQLSRRLSGALVIAGGLIAFGIYSGGDEAPKYQAFAADGEVFRVNTESGTIIACNGPRCMRILERGQDLVQDQGNTLFKAPPAPAPPAAQLPAPAAPQQAAPAAPAPGQPAQAPPQQQQR